MHKQFSELKFNIKVETKDNKYRITFYNFFTERVTIHGDAKSDGQSNIIHWQRVNSLKNEKAKETNEKKIKEYEQKIEREVQAYQEEWAATSKLMEALMHCTENSDF